MYKYTIIFALCMVATHCMTTELLSQGTLFTQEQRTLIENSALGRAVLTLAELQGKTSAFDFKPLWSALDELATSLEERKVEENQLYEKEHQEYLSDQQFYSNQITEYKNEVAGLEIEVADAQEDHAFIEQQLASKRGELEETTNLKSQSEKEVSNDDTVFAKQQQDYNDAIAVIDSALGLLNEVAEGSTLLQKGGEKRLFKVGEQMEETFKRLHQSRRTFYQPLVRALVQMAEQKFADQGLLKKTIGLMNDLRASLAKNKQLLADNYNSQRAQKVQIINEYASKIAALSATIIPGLESDLEDKNSEIRTKNGLLSDARGNLQDAVDSLEAVERRWVERTSSHRELVQQYDHELQVLEEAEGALKRGGISRY